MCLEPFPIHTCKCCPPFFRDIKTTVLVVESQVEKLTSVSDEQLHVYIHVYTCTCSCLADIVTLSIYCAQEVDELKECLQQEIRARVVLENKLQGLIDKLGSGNVIMTTPTSP